MRSEYISDIGTLLNQNITWARLGRRISSSGGGHSPKSAWNVQIFANTGLYLSDISW